MSLLENKAQEEAIRTIDGPLLIISCPGSGKTTTLVRRIHHMIEEGVFPSQILMVTFTKDAANGMNEKYRDLYGGNPGVTFATIHSLCFNILRREGRVANDSVVSERDKLDFLLNVIRQQKFEGAWDMAVAAANGISMLKNNYMDPKDVDVPGISSELFVQAYEAYQKWCEDREMIDFDDMLLLCLKLFSEEPAVLDKYRDIFRYIQVDEYQDTNYIQRDILYLLAGDRKNLCVVGDDDQSIYAFRGAKPEIMLGFEKDFPNVHVVRMGVNYRSASAVVECSARLITHNTTRFDKPFVSQRGESGVKGEVIRRAFPSAKTQMQDILREIEKLHKEGMPYKEMAVLFRTNLQAQIPVMILSDAEIPYYSTETVKTMYESFIFDDIMKYVRLSAGVGGRKEMCDVLNHPNRYFKEAAFRNAEYSLDGLMNAARYIRTSYPTSEFWRWDNAKENIYDWMQAFGPGVVSFNSSPKEVFSRMIGGACSIHYDKYIREYSKYRNLDPDEYKEMYKDLKEDAERFATIGEWFDYAAEYVSRIREEAKKKDKEGVVLTTMHRSKGLEWKAVFILEADEGKSPHKKCIKPTEIDEERRLFYVAMTRAKDILYIYHTSDKESRFLSEYRANAKPRTVLPKTDSYVMKPEDVPKYLPGKEVRHKKFGSGRVVRYQPGQIVVNFDTEGEKTLQFPETFCRGLIEYV